MLASLVYIRCNPEFMKAGTHITGTRVYYLLSFLLKVGPKVLKASRRQVFSPQFYLAVSAFIFTFYIHFGTLQLFGSAKDWSQSFQTRPKYQHGSDVSSL